MKIIKRGKKWWVDYTVDGKRHRQSTGTANRKELLVQLGNTKMEWE